MQAYFGNISILTFSVASFQTFYVVKVGRGEGEHRKQFSNSLHTLHSENVRKSIADSFSRLETGIPKNLLLLSRKTVDLGGGREKTELKNNPSCKQHSNAAGEKGQNNHISKSTSANIPQ